MQLRSTLSRAYFSKLPVIDHLIFMKYGIAKPKYKQLFNVITTDEPTTYTDQFSGLGLFAKKEEGSPGATDRIYQLYSKQYIPYTYTLLIEFSEEAVEDDRLGLLGKAANALGTSAWATQDTLAAAILNNGFDTTGPDGKALFATDHPLLEGMTAKNRPSTDMDFSYTSLGLALADWDTEQKDDRGQIVEIEPKVLWYHPSIKIDVLEVLKSMGRPDTANNATNVIKSDWSLDPVAWKRLIDLDAWGLLASPSEHEINIIMRKGFHTSHGTDDRVGKAWTRGRFRQDQGFSDWRGAWGTSGI